MERDRIIWDRRNADWAAVYGTKSQLESQKKKFFFMQAQMESRRMFEELTTKVDFIKRIMQWIAWKLKNYVEFAFKRRKDLDS